MSACGCTTYLIDEEGVNKLFIALMIVIVGINIYNAVKFGLA